MLVRRRLLSFFVAAILLAFATWPARLQADDQRPKAFRPPAVPLVTFDPYLSVWSEADRLTDATTRHWTGHEHSLLSLIRVDGKTSRLMGKTPADLPALPQKSVTVYPTRTVYQFDDGHVHVTMTFMTPALPNDLDALALPLSYINWDVSSVDGAEHDVAVFQSVSSQLAVHSPDQKVTWSREKMDGVALKIGAADQPLLQRQGDDTRIDWGYVYLAALAPEATGALGSETALARQFADSGKLPAKDDDRKPRAVNDDHPAEAITINFGKVGTTAKSQRAIVALDEIYAIKYFGKNLRPYWRRSGVTATDMLAAADKSYSKLAEQCESFDCELMADLEKVGGPRYAQIAALSYRQCLAAMGLAADAKGQPLLFTKENTSNGDIATVDVIFPMHPILLALSPPLAKASLVPVLNYAASPRWKFPNAPHDLGTYPVAKGTDDGGEGMPVEESGNMLILCDAIAQLDGNADFVAPWWPQLTQWAKYLEKYGLDPEEQLCTDDFMGHLAHNSNLSIKAILGLAAYGDLCKLRGDKETAEKYHRLAKEFATHWTKAAADGDHYNLAFDKPGTWSQKYNLVWDKLLGLNVFPPDVARKEIEHYKRVMQKYGVPLDSRTKLTKTDWSLWIATMASNQDDFQAIVSPIYDYLDQTSTRHPLVDSYITDDPKSDGMHSRPVVGGIFIKLLADPAMRAKWSARGQSKVGPWAPLPPKPKVVEVVPTSQTSRQTWRYATSKPTGSWTAADYSDRDWQQGPGPFGTKGTPGIDSPTEWKSADIWLRREITMPAGVHEHLQFVVYHDEDLEVFINGVPAATAPGFITGYEPLDMTEAAREQLKPGAKATIAVHCHQTEGGQGVDVGIADVIEQ